MVACDGSGVVKGSASATGGAVRFGIVEVESTSKGVAALCFERVRDFGPLLD